METSNEIIDETRFLEAQRKTYLRGELHGKFRGEQDNALSSLTPANFYNTSIYDAKVIHLEVRHEQDGPFPTKQDQSVNFYVENPVDCYFEGENHKGNHYLLTIFEQNLEGIQLSDIISEGNTCHGIVDAVITGYVEDTVKHYATGVSETKQEGFKIFERHEYKSHLGFNYWGDWQFKEYVEGPTGNEQKIFLFTRTLKRTEFINKKGETRWGKTVIEKEPATDWFSFLSRLLIGLIFISLLIALISAKQWGWVFLLVLIAAALYSMLFGKGNLGGLFRWGARILSFLFLLSLLFGIVNVFRTGVKHASKKVTRNDFSYRDETPDESKRTVVNDSIIRHFRVWKDYQNNVHSGFLSLLVSDYRGSYANHFATESTVLNAKKVDFKSLYYVLAQHDNPGMQMIFQEFERLAKENNYDARSRPFAELIVSCIQDIPYSLIIPSCNSRNVHDAEIRRLLMNDCPCKESFPDGVQAPLEFMADLKGDCDTRSLFLYSLLKHFGYDVVLMISERYKHAIIGVNFPRVAGNPVTKLFQGQKYYVWETTAPEMPLGALDPTVNNMNLWNVLLK
jgi:hypothetical protein